VPAGYHNDRLVRTSLFQLGVNLKTIHVRHVLVEDDTVWRVML
jgi:hypothetical protein